MTKEITKGIGARGAALEGILVASLSKGEVVANLVPSLAGKCEAALDAVAPAKGPYALLDFPFYANIGDSAIWQGSRMLLEKHHGMAPAYISTKMDFSADQLDRALPEGLIYIKGGGNFGDLYPAHHDFRTAIVRRYGDRVVQLPQSLHFDDAQVFEETKKLADLGMKLMVRDHPSDALGKELGFEPMLVPDFAFGLGKQNRPVEPDRDLLVLKRTDKEDTGGAVSGMDWGGEFPMMWLYAGIRSVLKEKRFSKLEALDLLAEMRVNRGFAMLSLGRAVATDRLHGHIMATLLSIPHYVSDNSTRKLTAYVDAWTADTGLVHKRADLGSITRAEAQALAQEFA